MKLLKSIFIGIPNFPFIIIISIHVLYNIWKHTGIVEMHMMEGQSFLTPEIKDYLNKSFPKVFFRCFALLFWLYIIFKIFT